jgi:hypothetical protein
MALIEIPNFYESGTAVSRARGRLVIIGEPVVAVDLINTVAAPRIARGEGSPLRRSRRGGLVADRESARAGRRPAGLRALRRLRAVLRQTIEALMDPRPVCAATGCAWRAITARRPGLDPGLT